MQEETETIKTLIPDLNLTKPLIAERFEKMKIAVSEQKLAPGLLLILEDFFVKKLNKVQKATSGLPNFLFNALGLNRHNDLDEHNIFFLEKEDGNILEKLLYCLNKQSDNNEVYAFLIKRYYLPRSILPECSKDYSNYPEKLQLAILTFMLCLRQKNGIKSSSRIPKYLIFLIINMNRTYIDPEMWTENDAWNAIESTLNAFSTSASQKIARDSDKKDYFMKVNQKSFFPNQRKLDIYQAQQNNIDEYIDIRFDNLVSTLTFIIERCPTQHPLNIRLKDQKDEAVNTYPLGFKGSKELKRRVLETLIKGLSDIESEDAAKNIILNNRFILTMPQQQTLAAVLSKIVFLQNKIDKNLESSICKFEFALGF